ncbi:Radical SAM protein [Candidatus Desulfarcum epimagneticum]|uniref:Radical SAM protein n=1 Tax=uncultured Desulfobacteraceae bacterium TaxID=218296 RepID=A0A484HJW4_9BACT|nr:Radical SAM protein [uncultured Desulfobacteraceae bacterium]
MGLLYTRFKAFHFKEKLDSLPENQDKILPPIHIRIKPTNVCNHNCSYCAYTAEALQLGQDMRRDDYIPQEKMMEIIDDLIGMDVKAVTFSGGGEPFCYPYFLKAVEKLSDSEIKFASLTNGSRLTGEIAEIFSYNATWLRISMDGWDDESYSEYRGVKPGEFSKIINNIIDFEKLSGKCHLGVCINTDKKNYSHIYKLIEKLRDSGVKSIKVAPCIISNNGKENNVYHKPIFDETKDQINRAKEKFEKQGLEIFDSYHMQLDAFQKDYSWCPSLQTNPVIGADLNVYSCQDKAYNLETGVIGSIKDRRFKDFWMDGNCKFYKINPSTVCNHHCVANNKNEMIMEYLNVDQEHLEFV